MKIYGFNRAKCIFEKLARLNCRETYVLLVSRASFLKITFGLIVGARICGNPWGELEALLGY